MSKIDYKLTSEEIKKESGEPVTVFSVQGWLDAQSEDKLVASAQEAHTQGARRIVINLQDVNTLTSAGIRALQKVYLLFNPTEHTIHSGRMRLCSAPPHVYHVLAITGFLQSAPMYETLQAALDSFTP